MITLPLIGYGHGGIINIDGIEIYTTAPDKMFKHKDGSIAYEGVYNRKIAKELFRLLQFEKYPYVDIVGSDLDIDLDNRIDNVNNITRDVRGKYYPVYFPIHNNAGGGIGAEVWTSEGDTPADPIAEILAQEIIVEFRERKFRADKKDNDLDKESCFYVLHNSICPAALPEFAFFDNPIDWKLMQTEDFPTRCALTILKTIKRINQEIL